MKKIISLLLAFILLFALCACEKDDVKVTEPTEQPTAAPTEKPTEIATTIATLPADEPKTEPVEELTEVPTQAPTEKPTQAPTEKPTQAPTEKPTQAPTEKPTQAPTEKPTQAPTQTPTQAPTQKPTEPKYTTYNIPALTQKTKNVAAATIKTFNGTLAEEGQIDEYTYTPARDGRYTFKLSEMKASIYVSVVISDHLGEVVEDLDYQKNGSYIAVYLEAGETYTCKIYQYTGLGSYILSIGEQTPTTDISAYSIVNDSVNFEKQINHYTFVPELDGRYTFQLSEMKAGIYLSVVISDHLGEIVEDLDYQNNGSYIAVYLEAGKTYTYTIYQYDKMGSYTLNIGKQKETTDIKVKSIVNDSIEFDKQINVYTFKATSEVQKITFSEMGSNIALNVSVLNYLDEEVAEDGYCANGDVIELEDLNVGKVYTIKVYQYKNSGKYTFTFE